MKENHTVESELAGQLTQYSEQIDWISITDENVINQRIEVAERLGIWGCFEYLDGFLRPDNLIPELQIRFNQLTGSASTDYFAPQQNDDVFSIYGHGCVLCVAMGRYSIDPPCGDFYFVRRPVGDDSLDRLLFMRRLCENKDQFAEALGNFIFLDDDELQTAEGNKDDQHPLYVKLLRCFEVGIIKNI